MDYIIIRVSAYGTNINDSDSEERILLDKETHPVMRNDFDGWRDDSEIDLVDIIDSLWKHKKLIAAFIAVCLICASAYLTVTPRSYESRATLLFLPPIPSEIGTEGRGVVMLTPGTYITLATAEDLLNDVINRAYADEKTEDRPTTDDMRRKMKVQLDRINPRNPPKRYPIRLP